MPLIGRIEPSDQWASINETRDFHNLRVWKDPRARRTSRDKEQPAWRNQRHPPPDPGLSHDEPAPISVHCPPSPCAAAWLRVLREVSRSESSWSYAAYYPSARWARRNLRRDKLVFPLGGNSRPLPKGLKRLGYYTVVSKSEENVDQPCRRSFRIPVMRAKERKDRDSGCHQDFEQRKEGAIFGGTANEPTKLPRS